MALAVAATVDSCWLGMSIVGPPERSGVPYYGGKGMQTCAPRNANRWPAAGCCGSIFVHCRPLGLQVCRLTHLLYPDGLCMVVRMSLYICQDSREGVSFTGAMFPASLATEQQRSQWASTCSTCERSGVVHGEPSWQNKRRGHKIIW
jgi:hypothetical protein